MCLPWVCVLLESSILNVGVVLVEISMVWTRLCAAQLMSCDVIMPDEPSGCMDVDNIGLLEDQKLEISWESRAPLPCSWRCTWR